MRTARAMTLTLALSAVTSPVLAQDDQGGGLKDLVTGENVGRLVGAGVGALLGSQVGSGDGKLAAVAVGALAGVWLGGEAGRRLTEGDRAGIAETTGTALETGESQTWTNPDTGVKTRVDVQERTTVEATPPRPDPGLRLDRAPPVDLIDAFYVAEHPSNVRAGPGTDHAVVGQLAEGERVAVIGEVRGRDWMMIAEHGDGSGYVYAPLLRRAGSQPDSDSAVRLARGEPRVETRECARIEQRITVPGGSPQSKTMRACQRADGTWEAV